VLDDCCRHGLHLLLPDGAFLEFGKGDRFFDTARRSLKLIAPYKELIFSARKVADLMAVEFAEQAPASSLIRDDSTAFLRLILEELDRSEEAALRRMADGPVPALLPAALEVWNNHDQNKHYIKVLHDALKADMQPDKLKALRRSPQEGVAKWLCSQAGMAIVFQGLKKRGADDATAYCLTRNPSVSAGFLSGLAGLAVYWISAGGIDSATATQFSGDLNDLEYVILGAFTSKLATDDQRAATICNAVRTAYEVRLNLPSNMMLANT
jgi:hypothetical protein